MQYIVDSVAELVDALRSVEPGDSLELRGRVAHWHAALGEAGWQLRHQHESLPFDAMSGARLRLVLDGEAFLLVGENGHASIQSAIDQAVGGETILIAPGTYGEGREFSAADMGSCGAEADTYGLVINKSVTLQGVSGNGAWISDCADVQAAAVALYHSREGVSFAVVAPGVMIRGIGLVPAGSSRSAVVNGRTVAVHARRFSLRGAVVERDPVYGSVSAIHFQRREGDEVQHIADIAGNILHGSLTIDATAGALPMEVDITGNEIHGDLLPAVLVICHADVLKAVPAHPLLPVIEDNALYATGLTSLAFAIQFDGSREAQGLLSRDLELYLREVLESHEEVGALIVDASGRVPTRPWPRLMSGRGKAPVAAIYATIRAAAEDAAPGDTLQVGAGIYREQIPLSGRHLALSSAPGPHGDPPVRLTPSTWAFGSANDTQTLDLSLHPAPRRSMAMVQEPPVADLPEDEAGALHAGEAPLADEHVLDLLDSGGLALPVRVSGTDGVQRGAFATLQQGIDAAQNGDRIEVAPGSYSGDLHIVRALTLTGANAGRPGNSMNRGLESAILGDVTIDPGPADVVIDGFTIRGTVSICMPAGSRAHLALRCCVVNASGLSAAIRIQSGSGTMIASNLIISGSDEGIYAPSGFDDLVISGNRLEIADGAAGIVLNGGAGTDSVYILGNTAVGGDYGILVEGGAGLDGPGDSITIAGNCFGELHDGMVMGAPAVAAISADRPVSRALERSLGACLQSNVYNLSPASQPVDIAFEPAPGPLREAGRNQT